MDHLSGRRQRLWEAMESCRNGSDDLSDPQFADLAARLAGDPELRKQFQRLQEADKAIKAAFADVPVPRRAGRSPFATPGRTARIGELWMPWPSTDHSTIGRRQHRFETKRSGFRDAGCWSGSPRFRPQPLLLAAVWVETHPSRHGDAGQAARRGHGLLQQRQSTWRQVDLRNDAAG